MIKSNQRKAVGSVSTALVLSTFAFPSIGKADYNRIGADSQTKHSELAPAVPKDQNRARFNIPIFQIRPDIPQIVTLEDAGKFIDLLRKSINLETPTAEQVLKQAPSLNKLTPIDLEHSALWTSSNHINWRPSGNAASPKDVPPQNYAVAMWAHVNLGILNQDYEKMCAKVLGDTSSVEIARITNYFAMKQFKVEDLNELASLPDWETNIIFANVQKSFIAVPGFGRTKSSSVQEIHAARIGALENSIMWMSPNSRLGPFKAFYDNLPVALTLAHRASSANPNYFEFKVGRPERERLELERQNSALYKTVNWIRETAKKAKLLLYGGSVGLGLIAIGLGIRRLLNGPAPRITPDLDRYSIRKSNRYDRDL